MQLRNSANRLVSLLNDEELQRLEGSFEDCDMRFKLVLYEPDSVMDYLYFPRTGVCSLITELDDGGSIETGTVGHEGYVGVPAVLGVMRAPYRCLCQIPGRALRLPVAAIGEERRRSSVWFLALLRYANFQGNMAAQHAACNRMHHVDARMSRWLLMTQDRVRADDFPLTQEFLSQMLGVARPTVNIAGATLQRAGLIRYTRGRITVLDRPGLEAASCECYARIQQELERTLQGEP